MMFVVVCGASELRFLADGLRKDDTLFEKEHMQLLPFVTAGGGVGHHQRLLEQ